MADSQQARVRTAGPKNDVEADSAIAAAEQRGFAQGLLEGKRVAETELAPARDNYDRTITAMGAAYSRLVAAVEKSAVKLATVMAEKIIRCELETSPEIIEKLVGETLEMVRLHNNVTVRLKKPGEAPVNSLEGALTPSAGAKPAGTLAAQRTMTAKVEAIDTKVPSITFSGPNGWKYSRKIQDKNVLKQVKVGDQVDFIWTEAIQITVASPK